MLYIVSVSKGLHRNISGGFVSQIIFRSIFCLQKCDMSVLVPENWKGVLCASWSQNWESWRTSQQSEPIAVQWLYCIINHYYTSEGAAFCFLLFFSFSFLLVVSLIIFLHCRESPSATQCSCPSLSVHLEIPSSPWSVRLAWGSCVWSILVWSRDWWIMGWSECLVTHGR